MSFDWKQESKEKYFRKVEELTEAAGLERFLVVDRSKFSIIRDKVKVYFVRIRRAGNSRRWNEARRFIEGIKEIPAERDEYGQKMKSIFIHGYIVLNMEEQDK